MASFADAAPRGTGLAVAAWAPGEGEAPEGGVTVCRGFTGRSGGTPVTARTGFEIGSVTKTFTALLLAEMAARGEVGLRDRLGTHLPAATLPRGPHGARSPAAALPAGPFGAGITLEHLATHTAGLPRLPPGLVRSALPRWFANPYAAFGPERLLPALARARVRRPPGTRTRYSNFGFGLLGRVLAEAAGQDYPTLLRARVLDPLGLQDAATGPAPGQATGHWHGRPRRPWEIPALPGAAALRCSARDLLRYLRALIRPEAAAPPGSPLRTALAEVLRPRPAAPDAAAACLSWTRRVLPTHTVYFHTGGTSGFTTLVGFSREPAVAFVALTNTAPTLRGTFIQSGYLLLRDLIRHPARLAES
ncbi:class A beta-lactamase-related serine hydrolase [Streptomyces hoynatensis]|uniref:Class A beta-lactamase-related serine hydrolase n=1 Tax=Streptomyces hoynatensis TaxID=1141874 RepID=A0A3A9YVT5_9ACTN|nr:class A beta-lactamase-related serine hydrolase [Streptomyces hoynatensis]